MVDINCVYVCRMRRLQQLTPEEPDRWSMEHDRKNVPPSRSGLSVPLTNGYDSVAKSCRLHADLHHVLSPTAFVPPFLHQGPKCPSGCRIQGLMNKYDHDLLKKVEKIRGILGQNEQKHRSTDSLTKQTYDYVKEQLRLDSGQTAFSNVFKESRLQC